MFYSQIEGKDGSLIKIPTSCLPPCKNTSHSNLMSLHPPRKSLIHHILTTPTTHLHPFHSPHVLVSYLSHHLSVPLWTVDFTIRFPPRSSITRKMKPLDLSNRMSKRTSRPQRSRRSQRTWRSRNPVPCNTTLCS